MPIAAFEKIMVCVTAQPSCARLIRAARALLAGDGEILVLSVQRVACEPEQRAKDLATLYELTRGLDSSVCIYYNDNPALVAATVAAKERADRIVTGVPRHPADKFVETIHTLVPQIPLTMVDDDETAYTVLPEEDVPVPMNPAWLT